MDLSALLAEVKMRPADLARQIGVSPGHIGDLISGRRRLTIEIAGAIERVTGRTGIVDQVVKSRTTA